MCGMVTVFGQCELEYGIRVNEMGVLATSLMMYLMSRLNDWVR